MSRIDQAWAQLKAWSPRKIADLIDEDPDNRIATLVRHQSGIRFDWCKTHLDRSALSIFEELTDAADLVGARNALFSGQIVNVTEQRSADHCAQRGEGPAETVAIAQALHRRMRSLIEAIDAGAFGEICHVLHIGIGGSALGPDLLVDALGRDSSRYDVAVVANVDGSALVEAVRGFDPHKTLIAIASKTFTTQETLLNAQSAIQWMRDGGVEDPLGKCIALTAHPEKALEWGVDETRILPFPDTIGGRYSLWCSIGFPFALAMGWDSFAELLEGAASMDRHFRLAKWQENAPVIAAFADLLYTQRWEAETRGVFAYDERLRLLPSYLQQLEMESNGKFTMIDGAPVTRPTAAITWGGVGTDAQHAVFQLLHQGTHVVPVEFLVVKTSAHNLSAEHHATLLGNCVAQGAALMNGRVVPDDAARSYPGDRPSVTILLDQLDPFTLGALIAFYEHRVFVNAALLRINPFDQFGVELGKEMAKGISGETDMEFDPATEALLEATFESDD